jgi:integrase
MIKIPDHIQGNFEKLLSQESIPVGVRPFYHKWLRYYWDFCHKYQHDMSSRESLQPFIQKLADKNQPANLIRQASHAVSIFYKYGQISQTMGKTAVATVSVSPLEKDVVPMSSGAAVLRSPLRAGEEFNDSSCSMREALPAEEKDGDYRVTYADWTLIFDGLKHEIAIRHYSPKTLRSYSGWARRLQAFTRSKDPRLLTSADVRDFLTFLAEERSVSASSQNQAFNALLFLFRHILKKSFDGFENVPRAKRKPYIPVVLSRQEIDSILNHLSAPYDLVVKLLYGCGLRLFECLNLRVQDINFDALVLTVHDGKGKKDRTLPLPETILPDVKDHLQAVIRLHERDLQNGYAGTFLVHALEKKFQNAARELPWQWFFSRQDPDLCARGRRLPTISPA